MPKRHVAAVAAVLALTATGAIAASAAETAIATRQAGYKKMGAAFKAINEELRKDAPDIKLIAAQAKIVDAQAAQVPGWFPKGSGPEAGFKTKAKPAIWAEPAKFSTAGSNLKVQAAKLASLSAAGDLAATKAQVRAVGGTCKSCHDSYRAED